MCAFQVGTLPFSLEGLKVLSVLVTAYFILRKVVGPFLEKSCLEFLLPGRQI